MSVEQLPEIKIVRHVRARHLRLRVEPHQVRLTAPLFCTKKQIQQFLNQSQDWLMQTWQKQYQQQYQQQLTSSSLQHIHFFNQDVAFQIVLREQQKNYIIDHEQANIFIRSNKGSMVLKDVVYDYAKQHLPVYLSKISREIGLSFRDCTVRRPKTRWGSCGTQRNIMLHAGLVLMRPEIVRYVCVHELAHTRHFNHSQQFWAEVEKFDPDYLIHYKQLKSYQLPAWWYQEQ